MLWLLLIVGVIGVFVYIADKKVKTKLDTKFNPAEWGLPNSAGSSVATPQPTLLPPVILYKKKPSVFNDGQLRMFKALQEALRDEYILLTNILLADALSLNSDPAPAAQATIRNIANRRFDFVICHKGQLEAACVIMLGDNLDPVMVKACEAVQLPLARFRLQSAYDIAQIRSSILEAMGMQELAVNATDDSALEIMELQDGQNDNLLQVVTCCPLCSTAMLKRKARRGNDAGKLFWICPRYPKCRGMLPVK